MQSKSFLLSEALAQAILDYLASRPYREVFKLVGALQSLPEMLGDDEEPQLDPEED
jgi:hypothetical protein